MNLRNTILSLLTCSASILLTAGLVYADANGPDPGLSGVPGEVGTCANCHSAGASTINTMGGKLSLNTGTASTYTPGEIQHWIITLADPTAKRWGFQATARLASSTSTTAGGLSSADSNTQVICSNASFRTAQRTTTGSCSSSNPLMYAEQTLTGTRNGTTGSVTFAIDWQAPATNVGSVTVYLAGNAANGNNNDDVGDHIYTATVTLTPASAAAAPVITQVVNGASFGTGIEAGSWVTIKGTNLTAATNCDAVNNPSTGCRTWTSADFTNGTPTSLDGVSVLIGGQLAFIYFISPAQINVQAPDVSPANVAVTVTNSSGTSNSLTAPLASYAPGFFQVGSYAVATHLDGTLVVPSTLISTATPAVAGETILLWGTGFGPVSPGVAAGKTPAQVLGPGTLAYASIPAVITVGGIQAQVVYDILSPNAMGLYQIAITLPANVQSGDQPVIATTGTTSSPSGVLLAVK